jgi:hypothetical protein
MDFSKLELLRQVKIEKPCPADWDMMTGDEQKRHCAGCGCDVINVAEMSSSEAETLCSSTERVCIRLTVDDQQSVLTRDGWIPRLLLAGAIAATVAGCGHHESADPTPSDMSVLKDKLIEVGAEAVYTAFPDARPQRFFAGAMVAPSLYMSGGSGDSSKP